MSRAAMQQGLAYIEEVDYGPYDKWPVIIALKQALAEPEQEPVGWQWLDTANYRKKLPANAIREHWRPLYTAPTPRKPLTDEEIQTIWTKTFEMGSSANTFARAIERAHGIREGQ